MSVIIEKSCVLYYNKNNRYKIKKTGGFYSEKETKEDAFKDMV